MGTGSALEENRRATDGAKRAHRRVHAAGNAPLGALEKLYALLHLKRLRYWLVRAAMSGASKRSLMTARRSAPARTSAGAFWTVMPPIAQRGTPRLCAKSSSGARTAPGLVEDGYTLPKAM